MSEVLRGDVQKLDLQVWNDGKKSTVKRKIWGYLENR